MALVKGICKNFGECDLADEKVVQEADKTNFVCEQCGKPLYPIDGGGGDPPPRPIWKRIGISAAILAVLAGGGFWGWKSYSHKSNNGTSIDTTAIDTTKIDSLKTQPSEPGPNGNVSNPKPPQPTTPITVFGGKATYDAKAKIIKVNATLTLTDSEGETITLQKGDVIRVTGVQGGNTLTQGECIINGESKLFTGEAHF